jgi:hypothetical protein
MGLDLKGNNGSYRMLGSSCQQENDCSQQSSTSHDPVGLQYQVTLHDIQCSAE